MGGSASGTAICRVAGSHRLQQPARTCQHRTVAHLSGPASAAAPLLLPAGGGGSVAAPPPPMRSADQGGKVKNEMASSSMGARVAFSRLASSSTASPTVRCCKCDGEGGWGGAVLHAGDGAALARMALQVVLGEDVGCEGLRRCT